ncbi:GntR family transcriptional regulator [Rhodococcus qingshengii]|uniref:GntR family transcriptional regulator n=1 Tax=Rhodococcus qingshengii TaxID=334542 RepID=A0AAW6LT20_RHOSG|nr:GntR family transcriptional regulator [Rhodococcus qingshengii]MDE8649346.1 GntR family transcriptional regulator [Rhodococcus qingshengii]
MKTVKTQPGASRSEGRAQLSAEVEMFVREEIMTGKFKAGQYIRTETLAAHMGVSQTPVREGLQALRGQGFLRLEPRKGFRVLELRRSDIDDIFGVQAHLTAELARRAATRLSWEQINELACIHEDLLAAAERGDAAVVQRLNSDFHRLINTNADAPKLTMLLAVALSYAPNRFYETTGLYPSSDERTEILEAMKTRDPERAADAMRRHIEHSGVVLQKFLDDKGILGN